MDYEIIDAEGFQAFCTVSVEIMELIIEDGDPSVMDLYFRKKNHIIGKFLDATSLCEFHRTLKIQKIKVLKSFYAICRQYIYEIS